MGGCTSRLKGGGGTPATLEARTPGGQGLLAATAGAAARAELAHNASAMAVVLSLLISDPFLEAIGALGRPH
jgi:hypothetical protein